jgi:ABC-2 type transport system permease protein
VYTACLPVRRRDIVKARVLCVAFLELFCLAVSIPSAVAAALFLPGWKSADGLPAAALYSIVFVQYALFNVSFLVLCYRKSGKPALAFFVGSIAYWAVFFVVTVLTAAIARVHAFMSAAGGMSQLTFLPVLAAGIAVWAGSLLLAYRICVKLFEKVNL